MNLADFLPPADPDPTPPRRQQFRLKDFAWVILVAAVLCAFFCDEMRHDP